MPGEVVAGEEVALEALVALLQDVALDGTAEEERRDAHELLDEPAGFFREAVAAPREVHDAVHLAVVVERRDEHRDAVDAGHALELREARVGREVGGVDDLARRDRLPDEGPTEAALLLGDAARVEADVEAPRERVALAGDDEAPLRARCVEQAMEDHLGRRAVAVGEESLRDFQEPRVDVHRIPARSTEAAVRAAAA